MKKSYPGFSKFRRFYICLLLSFFLSPVIYSQDFITKWVLPSDVQTLSFNALTTGEVTYT